MNDEITVKVAVILLLVSCIALFGGCSIYLSPDELKFQRGVESRLGNLEGRLGRVERQIDVPVLVKGLPTPTPTNGSNLGWEFDSLKWPEDQN